MRDPDHALTFDLDSDEFIIRKSVTATVRADVCGECGHVSLFVQRPAQFTAEVRDLQREEQERKLRRR